MKPVKTVLIALFILAVAAPLAAADEKDEIKERLKKRYPTLLKLINDQKVGEIYTGIAGAVKSEYLTERVDPADPASLTVAQFLAKENEDRGKLYEIIARGRDISAAQVGLLSGKQAFKVAAPDHYLKPKGADWVLKKDIEQPR